MVTAAPIPRPSLMAAWLPLDCCSAERCDCSHWARKNRNPLKTTLIARVPSPIFCVRAGPWHQCVLYRRARTDRVLTLPAGATDCRAHPGALRYCASGNLASPGIYLSGPGALRAHHRRAAQGLGQAVWDAADPLVVDGAGAESFAAFMWCVARTLARLGESPLVSVALFGHGQFMQALRWSISHRPQILDVDAIRACRAFDMAHPIANAGGFEATCNAGIWALK